MDNSQLWVIVVSSGASIIAVLVLFIRSLISEKKPVNGNGTKQSRECWEQHQTVLSKLDSVKRDIELLQKTMDSRTTLFDQIKERLADLNISVSHWDGPDRRK